MNISYLLIGGNEGDRSVNLSVAREHIARIAGHIRRASSIFETAPWGKVDQPDFFNQALEIETTLDAGTLMKVLLNIEERMGRQRSEKYGPRIIDIDILFFNNAIIRETGLTIPHPEIANRRFVLAPMEEIAPSFMHPVLRRTIRELLAACPDPLPVRKTEDKRMKYHFITLEGNIGAGKTTLAHLLSKHYNARLILEQFADNPFLPKFYENPGQYAFPLELFFMAERYKQLKELVHTGDLFQTVTLSDYLFTKCLLFAKVNLPEQEFRLYQKLFEIIHSQLVQPDILIYLHAPVSKLQENIRKRNRPYEQAIPDEYLFNIQETYTHYIRQHNIRTIFIDVSNADFLGNPRHLQVVLDALERDLGEGQHYFTLP